MGDYIHLKSNVPLAVWFPTREWKSKAERLAEPVEAIHNLVRKEMLQIK